MSIADSFLQGLQAPLQVPQAGLPMDMTPYVTALPDLKQHEQRVKEQVRMQKYIDDMAAKIKKENLDAQDEPSFLEGEEKMAFVSSNPWIRRKWLEKVANPSNPTSQIDLQDQQPLLQPPQQEKSQGADFDITKNLSSVTGQPPLSQSAFSLELPEESREVLKREQRRDTLLQDMYGSTRPADIYSQAVATKPREMFTDQKADVAGTPMEKYVRQYGQALSNRQPMSPAALNNKMMLGDILETIADPKQDPTEQQIAYLEKAKADQERQRYEIDLRNRFMEGRVNDDDIIAYGKLKEEEAKRLQDRIALQRGGPLLTDEEISQLKALQPSNQRLTDIARRNRQQYQRRVQNTLDSAANPEATKNVNYSILPGTTEVRRNSPQDLEAIKQRANRLKGQNVVGPRFTQGRANTEDPQFYEAQRGGKAALNPSQFPKLMSEPESELAYEQMVARGQRKRLINDRLNLLMPQDNNDVRRFSNDTQRLKNQISSYKPQPQEQSYSEYFSGLGNRLANLGTRLVRPVTTGAQQLASYALDRNMLGLADYVDDDQERLLNASLYHSTGDDVYKNRIGQARQRAIDAARPRAYSDLALSRLADKVRTDNNRIMESQFSPNAPPVTAESKQQERDLAANRRQLAQFEKFKEFRDAQLRAQADFDARLKDEDFFTKQLVGAQLRPFGNRDQYGDNQRDYFDAAEDSMTQAVKNYYGFEGGSNPALKDEYSLEGLKSPFRAARQEISDLYANPREYLREVALGLDKNNPLAPYAQQLTGIGITPEERAAEMLGTDSQAIEDALEPLKKSLPEQPTSEFDFTANDVIENLIKTPEGQQVARQLLRNVNPRLIQIQQALNAIDPNDREYYNKVTAILDSLDRQDLEALSRQNDLIQSVIGTKQQ